MSYTTDTHTTKLLKDIMQTLSIWSGITLNSITKAVQAKCKDADNDSVKEVLNKLEEKGKVIKTLKAYRLSTSELIKYIEKMNKREKLGEGEHIESISSMEETNEVFRPEKIVKKEVKREVKVPVQKVKGKRTRKRKAISDAIKKNSSLPDGAKSMKVAKVNTAPNNVEVENMQSTKVNNVKSTLNEVNKVNSANENKNLVVDKGKNEGMNLVQVESNKVMNTNAFIKEQKGADINSSINEHKAADIKNAINEQDAGDIKNAINEYKADNMKVSIKKQKDENIKGLTISTNGDKKDLVEIQNKEEDMKDVIIINEDMKDLVIVQSDKKRSEDLIVKNKGENIRYQMKDINSEGKTESMKDLEVVQSKEKRMKGQTKEGTIGYTVVKDNEKSAQSVTEEQTKKEIEGNSECLINDQRNEIKSECGISNKDTEQNKMIDIKPLDTKEDEQSTSNPSLNEANKNNQLILVDKKHIDNTKSNTEDIKANLIIVEEPSKKENKSLEDIAINVNL